MAPTATETVTVGKEQIWTVTIKNPGKCPLSAVPSITGSTLLNRSAGLVHYDAIGLIRPIVVPPGGTNSDLRIRFLCTSAIAGQAGTLTLTSNSPVAGTQQIKFNVTGVN